MIKHIDTPNQDWCLNDTVMFELNKWFIVVPLSWLLPTIQFLHFINCEKKKTKIKSTNKKSFWQDGVFRYFIDSIQVQLHQVFPNKTFHSIFGRSLIYDLRTGNRKHNIWLSYETAWISAAECVNEHSNELPIDVDGKMKKK